MAFDLNSITKESRARAPKGIIYGPPGVGKTTFGAGTGGLLLDTENGIPAKLEVAHTPHLRTWNQIKECLDWLCKSDHGYGAVVIDTCDWMLRRIEEKVSGVDCSLNNTLNKSHDGFGNGQQVLKNYVYRYLLPVLDTLTDRGIAIILLAHTTRRELTSHEGATFERSMPQLHKVLADIMIEWSDFVGAACIQAGERTLVLQETHQLVAKNRYGIVSPIPLSWSAFTTAIANCF